MPRMHHAHPKKTHADVKPYHQSIIQYTSPESMIHDTCVHCVPNLADSRRANLQFLHSHTGSWALARHVTARMLVKAGYVTMSVEERKAEDHASFETCQCFHASMHAGMFNVRGCS